MMPLALILKARGKDVAGTDRAYDQGVTPGKFEFLKSKGIELFAQDGSAVKGKGDILVISTAVEETVPDVVAARQQGLQIQKRAALLAELFNTAKTRIAIAGTSGKTTVTGMVAFLLSDLGLDPTVMNGGVMKNFVTEDNPYASALTGSADLFVTEADESDGSIALYMPSIAVLNNIALDHKPMEELFPLFRDFLLKADFCVLNFDCPNVRKLAAELPPEKVISYLVADAPDLKLKVPGKHNISNALAALGVAQALGLELEAARESLSRFEGIKRRMDLVGRAGGITVIDDFAHNPDKIAASLTALKESAEGRLIVFFQPHGYGPLKLLGKELADVFSDKLSEEDCLVTVEPYYAGGTVDRSVQMKDVAQQVAGPDVFLAADRTQAKDKILDTARRGDVIAIMGARDDTLSVFAKEILGAL